MITQFLLYVLHRINDDVLLLSSTTSLKKLSELQQVKHNDSVFISQLSTFITGVNNALVFLGPLKKDNLSPSEVC